MCAYKEDISLQVFTAIVKKLNAHGANKVDYSIKAKIQLCER